MKAEEKARELIDMFLPLVSNQFTGKPSEDKAKQCAVIAVDQIIKQDEEWIKIINQELNPNTTPNTSMFQYWQKVKEYIQSSKNNPK